MLDHSIMLPSKPRVVSEDATKGVYEIDNLYPGYGHTLGNSLRRIILSSLPGAALTSISIDGISHEFSTIEGVKEDVIMIILALKKVRFKVSSDEPQQVTLKVKGPKVVTAGDIVCPGQVEVINTDEYITEITGKGKELSITMNIETGLGFVQKDMHQKSKTDIGTIALDALFSPIRRVAYEVENMRVGDKTNHNRLRMIIETDGSVDPREALKRSIEIMITQLKAIFDFKFDDEAKPALKEESADASVEESEGEKDSGEDMSDILKTRIDTLELSTRTLNALNSANIRTVGGIARKKKEDLLELEGIGEKGIQEIRRMLSNFGITLK
ncbi:MAG: DNA-directed RNA polymerase subunit alpha [Candidatus Pacebacteria bacterium]|nr:DNA-directed RNA polymerase subunit alpha [Candidatus Paceibacterota bacterium]MBP9772453.1 DNA-directed RNA polymerase subunit alpha [Candidatus Paceibacterota bacterium]